MRHSGKDETAECLHTLHISTEVRCSFLWSATRLSICPSSELIFDRSQLVVLIVDSSRDG
jgi:hypothetical protein